MWKNKKGKGCSRMPIKIVQNDITKMQTDAIVNTANKKPVVGPGCDRAVYEAAGFDQLLAFRKENVGFVQEGDVFITPGFDLQCDYIIHAVSPPFFDGNSGEEEKLRSCYRKSLKLARKYDIRSIAFPLISTGSFGYPKEEGLRIALDEIDAFLAENEMLVYLVVFDQESTSLGQKIYPDLKSYIDRHYVEEKAAAEYDRDSYSSAAMREGFRRPSYRRKDRREASVEDYQARPTIGAAKPGKAQDESFSIWKDEAPQILEDVDFHDNDSYDDEPYGKLGKALEIKMKHMTDTFSQYLIYLIESKGMTYPEVYKRAIVDKKVFSKIKNNPDYHPSKIVAMCLCVGAKLNMDEARDLLARAGYALSPCDMRDIIFSYFIENGIYNMIVLDIQLENFGLPCLIA